MKPILAAIVLSVTTSALTQVLPYPVGADPRIQMVDYDPDQVIQIHAAQGYQVTLQFGSDERIENVAVGDSAAWQVTANGRGDLLFVKPVREGVTTNLTVATDARLYAFELAPSFGGSSNIPYTIRFRYPAPAEDTSPQVLIPDNPEGRYRVSGTRILRPRRIADDGLRTYIEWPEDQPLPAVYTVDQRGREELVNGNMRDGLYVIDSVLPRLIFKIDRHEARAVRLTPRGSP